MPSQLAYLRSLTSVDCDTLDLSVAESLGPFVDCTSNQAIAFFELQSPDHAALIAKCASLTHTDLASSYSEVPAAELCTELFQVHLSARMLPHLTNRTHVQTNPKHAFSTSATIDNARRIVSHLKRLRFEKDRVCIKIPSTWEGLKAMRVLEDEGIACLATTLFTMTQAAVAGAIGATYIAPYVNDLRVHFMEGFSDQRKGFDVCVKAQKWYEQRGLRTQVLPASLISCEEVMRLRGVKHLTVAPGLLRKMQQREWIEGSVQADLDVVVLENDERLDGLERDEARFRFLFNREGDGVGVEKLCHAINIFCDFQDKIEKIAEVALRNVGTG